MNLKKLILIIFKPFRPIEVACPKCGKKIVTEKVTNILPDSYEIKQIMQRGWYVICPHCWYYVYLAKDLEKEIDKYKK